jgi:hypothetical protein
MPFGKSEPIAILYRTGPLHQWTVNPLSKATENSGEVGEGFSVYSCWGLGRHGGADHTSEMTTRSNAGNGIFYDLMSRYALDNTLQLRN